MELNHLKLKVDSELSFSVNTQIKEQLKWLIGIGPIRPGELLPSASQLADKLGLNRNTINWVYSQLRDEGLVTMQKGRGTHVINGSALEQLRRERLPMQKLLTRTIDDALSEGIDLYDFFFASLAFLLLHHQQPAEHKRILFVECKEHDHPFYQAEIKRATHHDVQTIFIEDLESGEEALTEALHPSTVVITTLNHAEEVKLLLSPYDKKVHVIGATVSTSFLLELAKLKADTSVCFVCLGKRGGEWMASRVDEAGISQIRPTAIGLVGQEQLEETFEQSDIIYASAAVFSELKQRVPNKVVLYPMLLEKSSENLLQELAAPPSTPK